MTNSNPKKPSRRRARNSDGSFKGDLPGTKQNEAWVAEDVSAEVGEKTVEKTVGTPIDSASKPNKYAPKKGVRPYFGKVTITDH